MSLHIVTMFHSLSVREESETTTWREVRQYLDPNPQLKGLNKGQYEEKVNGL